MKALGFLFASFVACAIIVGSPSKASAQQKKEEIKEVTIWAAMHCESCKNKIEREIAFEKGVKSIEVNLKEKTVTIKYKADKNTDENLAAAIKKLGYDTRIIKKEEKK